MGRRLVCASEVDMIVDGMFPRLQVELHGWQPHLNGQDNSPLVPTYQIWNGGILLGFGQTLILASLVDNYCAFFVI